MEYKDLPVSCRDHPGEMRICTPWMCVPLNETCPCLSEDFLCTSMECVPRVRLCDGVKDCQSGDDEASCSENDSRVIIAGVPLSVFATSLAACLIVVLVLSVCLYYSVRKYYKHRSSSTISSKEQLESTTECGYDVIQVDEKKMCQMELNSPPSTRKAGLSKYNLGYELVSQDTLCNFGEELLCTSTPRQGVRGRSQYSNSSAVQQGLFVAEPNNNVRTHTQEEPRAIGDGSGSLNLALFESIT